VGALIPAPPTPPPEGMCHGTPPWDRPPTVTVLEVLRERKVDDDEWMYVMQQLEAQAKHEAAVDGPLTAAAEACLEGNFGTAVEQYESVPARVFADHSIFRHARQCAETCMRHGLDVQGFARLFALPPTAHASPGS